MTNPYDPDKPGHEDSAAKSEKSANEDSTASGQQSYDQTASYNASSFEQEGHTAFGQPTFQQQYNQGGYQQPYNNQTGYQQPFGQAGYQQQQYYGQNAQAQGFPGYGAGNPQAGTGVQRDSFFSALFDLSFTKYVTPSVVKALYLLLMIVVGLLTLFLVLGTFMAAFSDDGSPILLIVMIPLILIGAIAYLALYRIGLEVALSLIRTSQSVQSIDERQERQLQSEGRSGFGQGSGSHFGG